MDISKHFWKLFKKCESKSTEYLLQEVSELPSIQSVQMKPSTTYSHSVTKAFPGVIPENRNKNSPWALLDVAQFAILKCFIAVKITSDYILIHNY